MPFFWFSTINLLLVCLFHLFIDYHCPKKLYYILILLLLFILWLLVKINYQYYSWNIEKTNKKVNKRTIILLMYFIFSVLLFFVCNFVFCILTFAFWNLSNMTDLNNRAIFVNRLIKKTTEKDTENTTHQSISNTYTQVIKLMINCQSRKGK